MTFRPGRLLSVMSMAVATRLYSLSTSLVVWSVLVPAHLIAIALGRDRLAHLRERLGGGHAPAAGGSPRIILHGVSAGEMSTAGLLVDRLIHRLPHCSIILTTGTASGRQVAERLASRHTQVDAVMFLPWDRPAAVGRWLERLQADAVVTVEAELWPNLFLAAARRRIALFVVNGRLSAGDASRYALAGWFFRHVLAAATWIGVQDAEAFDAYQSAGATVERMHVVGNMKIDTEAAPAADMWLSTVGDTPVIVCGSTHAPEERWLLQAYERLRKDFPALRLVLAPRDPSRAHRIGREAARRRLRMAFWSRAEKTADWDVLVVDEMGPLASLYQYAAVAVAGGTFAWRGGHNIIEAARCGRAIVVGPHVANIRTTVADLDAAGGICRVSRGASMTESLVATLASLVASPGLRTEIGETASRYCREHGGATERCAQAIADGLRAGRRHAA